jgi:hypothetical protein
MRGSRESRCESERGLLTELTSHRDRKSLTGTVNFSTRSCLLDAVFSQARQPAKGAKPLLPEKFTVQRFTVSGRHITQVGISRPALFACFFLLCSSYTREFTHLHFVFVHHHFPSPRLLVGPMLGCRLLIDALGGLRPGNDPTPSQAPSVSRVTRHLSVSVQ